MRFLRTLAPFALALGLSSPALASSSSPDGVFRDVDETSFAASPGERAIAPKAYRLLELQRPALDGVLSRAPMEGTAAARTAKLALWLPMPDGNCESFEIEESPIMEPALQARFPDIRTYRGQGIEDPTATVRFDVTPAGFHAMVLSQVGTWYIDPLQRGDVDHYMSYAKSALTPRPGWRCDVTDTAEHGITGLAHGPLATNPNGPTLRTYRLALACTGEYAAKFGGTVNAAFAAMTTSMNRVNGIYEKEVGIHMNFVASEMSLVYTNPATDPYTDNTNSFALVTDNQANIDSTIGNGNYDIGHVFSTAGGGLAGVGVVCRSGLKAQGETGTSNPTGDGFDVDYVAHEMGHQFGGDHTFNGTTGACGGGNRAAAQAYEPGSGSTIMAYAGICGAEDLQPHSDDYFHVTSYDQIIAYTHVGSGSSCSANTNTGNSAPTVSAGSNFTIPKSTPFALTATGSDPNGDTLTFTWEEFDLGTAAPPNTDDGSRPIFRSFKGTTSPSRTFPKLSDILTNAQTFGESLPTATRSMTFRVTARDNKAAGGGVDYASMTLNVTSSGPFTVTAPLAFATIVGGSSQTVSWNVAGTSGAPVSCANVSIFLSTDAGNTFPTTLSASTANNGAAVVTIPNTPTTTARVKVSCVGNVFFNVNPGNFTITQGSGPTLTSVSPSSGPTAGGTDVTLTGSGFVSGLTVTFGGSAATNVVIVSSTTITCRTPAHAAGAVDVTATLPAGAGSATLQGGYTYVAPGGCVTSGPNLCVQANRFSIHVNWTNRYVQPPVSGVGTAIAITSDTGYFWFFNSSNVELIIKVLDGRAVNGKFWVFYGALSDVEYTVFVTDTQTAATHNYFSANGNLKSVADINAF